MKVVKVISTKFNEAGQMLTKLLKSGRNDVQEVKTVSLPGIDSVPLKDDIALYDISDISGENFVIGFIVKNRKAEPGETRLFSLDANGAEKIYLWLKKDGTIHFGGDADNLIRYAQTAASINELKNDINDLKNIFAGWVPAAGDGGAALKAALASYFASPIVEDITSAKIDEFKTL